MVMTILFKENKNNIQKKQNNNNIIKNINLNSYLDSSKNKYNFRKKNNCRNNRIKKINNWNKNKDKWTIFKKFKKK